MALNTKAIKRRIKSITSTRKITKAMEMISAVKMRRAMQNVNSTRSYSSLAWEIINDVAKRTNIAAHLLLNQRPIKKIGMIIVTSNRGLAGGFNSRLMAAAHQYVLQNADIEVDAEIDIILTGKHGRKGMHRLGKTVIAEFEKIDLTTRIEEVLPMAQLAMGEFIKGTYDKIVVAYNHFDSPIQQTPKIKQILPLEPGTEIVIDEPEDAEVKEKEEQMMFDDDDGEKTEKYFAKKKKENESYIESHYTFEPGANAVLDNLLPRLVEMQIYQAILESDASEHSARMMAMRNASDAAKDMIKELNYTFNKARQAAITQEISEIVGGAAALE